MPVHRIQRARPDEAIAKIERSGETVVSVVVDGPSHLLVFTRLAPAIEQRVTYNGPETAA